MVQQGYQKGGARYSARAATRRGRQASGEDAAYPAGRATVQAGLRSYALNKAEQLRFAHCAPDYREARNIVLGKWDADITRFLTEEECLAVTSPGKEEIVREAYAFLLRQGAINFGLLQGDPRVPLPAELAARVEASTAAAAAKEQRAGEGTAEPIVSDEQVAEKLFDIMGSVDMNAMTEKLLRRQVGKELGVDLSDRKNQIRALVMDYLASQGPPAWFKAKQKEARRRQREEARRRRWHVVVVGAGPAGLTAALHLKRNGVDVTVLEARERVGGRVHSYQQAGFTAPVDLGASIITGINPDVEKGLRSDPSAIIIKQLDIQLHELSEKLILLDTVTGQPVPHELDESVEKLRDELMDDVADALDELPEEQRLGLSYGELLAKAIQQRQAAADAAAAKASVAVAAAPPAVQEEEAGLAAGGAAPVAPASVSAAADPEVENALAMLIEPAALPPSLLPDSLGADLGLGLVDDLLLGGAGPPPVAAAGQPDEQKAVDDFLASVLASPSPKKSLLALSEPAVPEPAAVAAKNGAADAATAPSNAAAAAPVPAENGVTEPAVAFAVATKVGGVAAAPDEAVLAVETEATTWAAVEPAGEVAVAAAEAEAAAEAPLLPMTADQRRLLHWHWANLEYGCSARLEEISAPHWNQDEDAGGFGGAHCMVVGGYDAVFKALAAALGDCIQLSTPVVEIRDEGEGVTVVAAGGAEHRCDVVVVTLPLGVLKAGAVRFVPELPAWKLEAVRKLGFGDLNKVVLEFPSVFWDDSADYFGAAGEPTGEARGWCFMFWNFHRFSGANTLAALVSGASARAAEDQSVEELRDACLQVLRRVHPGVEVPEPTTFTASKWASELYSRGSYSFVAVGASGQHYDQLAQPVGRRLLFAGEHTAREHPDTVGGAMLSGLREAARVLDMAADEEQEEGERGTSAPELEKMASLGRKRKSSAAEAAAAQSLDGDDEGEDWGDARPLKSGMGRDRGGSLKKQRSSDKQEGGERGGDGGQANIWRYVRLSEIGQEMDWVEDEVEEQQRAEAPARDRQQQKKRKKRGDDDEVVSEDDLEKNMERKVAAMIGKERQWLNDEQQKAQRASSKLVVRAAMLAGAGQLDTMQQLIQCTPESNRHFVIMQLRQVDHKAWERLSADGECMTTIASWLEEAAREGGESHVVDAVLRLLQLMPCEAPVLEASGLLRVVKMRCATHSDTDLRKLASEVLKKWQPPAEVAANGASGSVSWPASRQGAGSGAATARRQPLQATQEDIEAYLDADKAAELAELERQALAAAEEAEAMQAALAAQQAEGDSEPGGPIQIKSWEEFAKGEKRKPKEKLERVAKAARRDSVPGSGGPGGPEGIKDEGTRKEVAKFVERILKPLFDQRSITKEEFKWVARKTVGKVCKESSHTSGREFLTDKKCKDIKILVNKYLQRRRELMAQDAQRASDHQNG